MGNGLSGTEIEDVFGGWCVGSGRRKESEEDDNIKRRLPKSLSAEEEEEAKRSEDASVDDLVERIRAEQRASLRKGSVSSSSSASSPKASNPQWETNRTAITPKRSAAQLVRVGLKEGKVKDKYMTHASLDDALAQGLIDVDEYAEKLRRLDSLDTAQEDELERIRGESTGTRQEE